MRIIILSTEDEIVKNMKKIVAGIVLCTMIFNSGINFYASATDDQPQDTLEQNVLNENKEAKMILETAKKTNSIEDLGEAEDAWTLVYKKYEEEGNELYAKKALALIYDIESCINRRFLEQNVSEFEKEEREEQQNQYIISVFRLADCNQQIAKLLNNEEAEIYEQKAKKIYTDYAFYIHRNARKISLNLGNWGDENYNRRYNKALELYEKSMQLFRNLGDEKMVSVNDAFIKKLFADAADAFMQDKLKESESDKYGLFVWQDALSDEYLKNLYSEHSFNSVDILCSNQLIAYFYKCASEAFNNLGLELESVQCDLKGRRVWTDYIGKHIQTPIEMKEASMMYEYSGKYHNEAAKRWEKKAKFYHDMNKEKFANLYLKASQRAYQLASSEYDKAAKAMRRIFDNKLRVPADCSEEKVSKLQDSAQVAFNNACKRREEIFMLINHE